VNYPGSALAGVGEILARFTLLVVAWLIAAITLALACRGIHMLCAKARSAWQRRRIEADRRAEVARGLAEIERFLAGASGALPEEAPDPDHDGDSLRRRSAR
jgi:hypothetical protein